jgi:hypothetical protein
MVVIAWQLDLHLPVQSVPNTTTRVVIVWQLDFLFDVQVCVVYNVIFIVGPNRLGAGSTWAGTTWAETTWGRTGLGPDQPDTLIAQVVVNPTMN